MTLDTNPYDTELSALVDTWQRRFNLELQRALAAESLLAETRAERDAWQQQYHDACKLNPQVVELRETREALERAASILARAIESFGMCALGSPRGQIKAEARAFLARLPTEEE